MNYKRSKVRASLKQLVENISLHFEPCSLKGKKQKPWAIHGEYAQIFVRQDYHVVFIHDWFNRSTGNYGCAYLVRFEEAREVKGSFWDFLHNRSYKARVWTSSLHVFYDAKKERVVLVDPIVSGSLKSEGLADHDGAPIDLYGKEHFLLGEFWLAGLGGKLRIYEAWEGKQATIVGYLGSRVEPRFSGKAFNASVFNVRSLWAEYFFSRLVHPLSGLAEVSLDSSITYNYDFQSEDVSAKSIDWPVTFIFKGFRTIGEVKNYFFGETPFGNEMKMLVKTSASWTGDRGTKGLIYLPLINGYPYGHMRLYRIGEDLVAGTSHLDQFPVESWSGYSLLARKIFVEMASIRGLNVKERFSYLYNREGPIFEDNHPRLHSGYASLIRKHS